MGGFGCPFLFLFVSFFALGERGAATVFACMLLCDFYLRVRECDAVLKCVLRGLERVLRRFDGRTSITLLGGTIFCL